MFLPTHTAFANVAVQRKSKTECYVLTKAKTFKR